MANTVKLKRSATPAAVPTTGQLDLGEIAINTYDGKVYIKKDDGTAAIVEVGAGGGGGSGTVTSVAVSGGSTGLTTTGGPVTSSGTISLGGTLAIANGGTGQTTATAAFDALAPTTTTGDIIYHNGTDNVRLGVGSTGQVLTVAAGAPSWAAAGGGGSTYYKDAVRVATTANGTLASAFENGDTVDGVVLATGDRILLKNQSSAVENGIYTVNASGAPTRATDFDANAEVLRGCQVYVQFGTVNGGNNFQVWSSNGNPIVVGTSTIVFGPAGGVAGNGMSTWTAPTATGTNDVAIGNGASAAGGASLAIGRNAKTAAADSICIGVFSSAPSLPGGTCHLYGSYRPSSIGNNTISIGGGNGSNSGSNSLHINLFSGSSSTSGSKAVNIGMDTDMSAASTGSFSLGHYNSVIMANETVFGSYGFVTRGDAQTSNLRHWQTTTNGTATEIGTSGSSSSTTPTGRIVLTNDSSYIFDCDIIARNTATDTESSAWNLKFAIRRGAAAANTALIGSATKTVIGQDSGTTTWGVSVTADTTNGRPNISVTGEASKTIRWVANIRMTKVSG